MKAPSVFAAVLLVLPMAASADESFRCGKWIASSDLSVEDLRTKCGEPTSRATSTQDVLTRNQFGLMHKTGETAKEIWTYDRGTSAAAMVVTIVDGRIKSIERQK